MDEYIVYVKADSNGVITAINSSAFISGEGWTEIDRGESDRFHHAQGNYLGCGLTDADGRPARNTRTSSRNVRLGAHE